MKYFKTSAHVTVRGGLRSIYLTRELKSYDMGNGLPVQILVCDDMEADLRECLPGGTEYPMYHIAVFATYNPEEGVEYTATFDVRYVTSAKELTEKLRSNAKEDFIGVLGPVENAYEAGLIKDFLESRAPEVMKLKPKDPVQAFNKCFRDYLNNIHG